MLTSSLLLPIAAAPLLVQSSSDGPKRAGISSTVLWTTPAPREGWFGGSVTTMDDLDGDGVTDLLVGNPAYWREGAGSVSFLSGRDGHVISTLVQREQDVAGGDFFGTGLTSLGDLDGDGWDDAALVVLTESYLLDRAYILSGRTRHIVASIEQAHLGCHWFAKLGDIDGDGRGDWLTTRSGGIEARSGIEGRVLYRLPIQGRFERGWRRGLGADAEVVGDLDGDGVNDFAVTGCRPETPDDWGEPFQRS
jgi:hypothetical protein